MQIIQRCEAIAEFAIVFRQQQWKKLMLAAAAAVYVP